MRGTSTLGLPSHLTALAALLFIAPLGLAAQTQTPSASQNDPAEVVRRLMDEEVARGEAYSMLQELCTGLPHRLSGSEDAANAEAWALKRMRAAGLQNVRLEECTVPHWVRGRIARLGVVTPAEAKLAPLPILALGGSIATPPGGLRGRVVVVRSWDELKTRAAEARGAILLLDRPMDPTEHDPFEAYGKAVDQRGRGAVEGAKVGAKAVLVRSMTLRLDDFPHTGAMHYDDGVTKIPAAAISTAGAERLAALVRAHAAVEVELELDCKELPDVTAHNVVGEIVGRERPDEFVVVGGHLDAWDVGEGAHDDGAGCVQAIEALRLVRALGPVPRRSLRCVLWMNEENGLRGARAYKAAHAAELDRHVLTIESDRGGFAPRGFGTNAAGAAWDALAGIAALLAPGGAGTLEHGGGGADTSPLEAAGGNVMELLPDPARYFDYHPSARDTVDQVHPRELALGAGALASLAWCVAELPDALPRPTPAATPPPASK
ncbi:MAG: M20/M25/M40 family metallo-hydrolase [Planctomycetes bacterium]|nr:M20/M25/M40 family metallo-hydrolase [Planctomycetota bacterium]